jgi:hypothetical protein
MESTVYTDENLNYISKMIVGNPKIRADYFLNPSKVLTQLLPRKIKRTKAEQCIVAAKVANKVEKAIRNNADSARLISFREALVEREVFLKEAMRNPQRTFQAVYWMSVATFLIGVCFVLGAFLAVLFFESPMQQAIIGGLSGGAGSVATLGAVFATSMQAMRRNNGDNAQIRMILTAFVTELTHLRGLCINNFETAKKVNAEIGQVMKRAIAYTEKYVEEEGSREQGERAQENLVRNTKAHTNGSAP